MLTFSMRSARSGGFAAVIAMAVILETAGLHLLLAARYPWVAWTLTVTSLSVLWWIAADHRALDRTAVVVGPNMLEATVGRRMALTTPLSNVRHVGRPALMPTAGRPAGYVNATKPAPPNVVIVFHEPVVGTIFGMRRPVAQLALCLDEPQRFIDALPPSRAWSGDIVD